MNATPEMLQGQVTYSPPSFQESVVGNDAAGFYALPVEERTEVAGKFFQKHFANQPDFRAMPQQDQNEIRTKFFAKNVYRMGLEERRKPNPLLDIPLGAAAGLGEAFSFIRPAVGLKPFKSSDFLESQDNPYFNAGSMAGNIAGTLDSGLLATAAAGGNPLIGFGGLSAIRNTQDVMDGRQNIGQAVFNTGLDAALAGYAPAAKTVGGAALKNAGLGAAGAVAGTAGNQLLSGQPFNPQQITDAAAREALLQGAIAAALNRGKPILSNKPPAPVQKAPTYQGRVVKQGDFGRMLEGTPAQIMERRVTRQVNTAEQSADSNTIRATARKLQALANAPNATPQQKTNAQRLLASAEMALKRTEGRKEIAKVQKRQFGEDVNRRLVADKVPAKEKQAIREQFYAKARKEKQVERDQAKVKQKQYEADYRKLVAEEKASQQQQARLKAEAQKVQNLKAKQAAQSQLAKEKADSQNRQRELRQLKAQIKETIETQAKQSTGVKPEQVAPKEPAQKGQMLRSPEGRQYGAGLTANQVRRFVPDNAQPHFKTINKAMKDGKQVRIYVRNERVGETSQVPFRDVSPQGWKLAKDGTVFLEAINPDGKPRVYVMKKSGKAGTEGHFKAPEILDTPAVNEPVETGRGSDVAIPTSVREAATKHLPDLDRKIKAGLPIHVTDIIDAAIHAPDAQRQAFLEALPQPQRAAIYKKITGKNC